MPAYSVNNPLSTLCFVFSDADPKCCLSNRPGLFGGAPTIRFYYNKVTKLCERFIYNGYLGNANNFESLELCLITCYGAIC